MSIADGHIWGPQLNNGQTIIMNDYLDAYFWLRDKTPKDARVMAWSAPAPDASDAKNPQSV